MRFQFSQIFESEQALVAVRILALLTARIFSKDFDGWNPRLNYCICGHQSHSTLIQLFCIRKSDFDLVGFGSKSLSKNPLFEFSTSKDFTKSKDFDGQNSCLQPIWKSSISRKLFITVTTSHFYLAFAKHNLVVRYKFAFRLKSFLESGSREEGVIFHGNENPCRQ